MAIDLKTSINVNDYQYIDNLIAAEKEAKVYKAVHLFDQSQPPLVFKGYPEDYLSDVDKQKLLTQ